VQAGEGRGRGGARGGEQGRGERETREAFEQERLFARASLRSMLERAGWTATAMAARSRCPRSPLVASPWEQRQQRRAGLSPQWRAWPRRPRSSSTRAPTRAACSSSTSCSSTTTRIPRSVLLMFPLLLLTAHCSFSPWCCCVFCVSGVTCF
jgi:hypothetical protein